MRTTTSPKPDQYATKRDLLEFEHRIDRRLEQQSKEIVGGLTGVVHEVIDRFDDRFVRLELRMDRIQKRMDNLEKEVSGIREDIVRLFDLADKIIKQQEISEQERLVMGHQLNRLDQWVHDLADKIGVKLAI